MRGWPVVSSIALVEWLRRHRSRQPTYKSSSTSNPATSPKRENNLLRQWSSRRRPAIFSSGSAAE